MIADELAALAEVMIPGDDAFPSASAVGAHAVLASRLRELGGAELVERVVTALGAAGGPLAPLAGDARTAVVERFERAEPELFAQLRMALYLAYYEQPDVIAAVRGLGFDYNDAPLPRGYALEPFDPAIDAPRHRRGGYVATESVRRVDLSGLDFLGGEAQR
jgi:hypothetical protein